MKSQEKWGVQMGREKSQGAPPCSPPAEWQGGKMKGLPCPSHSASAEAELTGNAINIWNKEGSVGMVLIIYSSPTFCIPRSAVGCKLLS